MARRLIEQLGYMPFTKDSQVNPDVVAKEVNTQPPFTALLSPFGQAFEQLAQRFAGEIKPTAFSGCEVELVSQSKNRLNLTVRFKLKNSDIVMVCQKPYLFDTINEASELQSISQECRTAFVWSRKDGITRRELGLPKLKLWEQQKALGQEKRISMATHKDLIIYLHDRFKSKINIDSITECSFSINQVNPDKVVVNLAFFTKKMMNSQQNLKNSLREFPVPIQHTYMFEMINKSYELQELCRYAGIRLQWKEKKKSFQIFGRKTA